MRSPQRSVLEVEALGPEPPDADADLDLLAELDGGAEVDLDAREDHRHLRDVGLLERPDRAHELDPRGLDPRQEDGVVHVPHRIQVAEARGPRGARRWKPSTRVMV